MKRVLISLAAASLLTTTFATAADPLVASQKVGDATAAVNGTIKDATEAVNKGVNTVKDAVTGTIDAASQTTGIDVNGFITKVASGNFSIKDAFELFGFKAGEETQGVLGSNLAKLLFEQDKLTYDNGLLKLSCELPDLDIDLSNGFCSGRIAEAKNEVNNILSKLTKGFSFGSCTLGLSSGNKLCNETFIEKACKDLENVGTTLKEGFKKGLASGTFENTKEMQEAIEKNSKPLARLLQAANSYLPIFTQTNKSATSSGEGCLLGTTDTEIDKQKSKDGTTPQAAVEFVTQCIKEHMLSDKTPTDKVSIMRSLENRDIPLTIASSGSYSSASTCDSFLTSDVKKNLQNLINNVGMLGIESVKDAAQTAKDIAEAAKYASDKSLANTSYGSMKEMEANAKKAAKDCESEGIIRGGNSAGAAAYFTAQCKKKAAAEATGDLRSGQFVQEAAATDYTLAQQAITGGKATKLSDLTNFNTLNLNAAANQYNTAVIYDTIMLKNQLNISAIQNDVMNILSDVIQNTASIEFSKEVLEQIDADIEQATATSTSIVDQILNSGS